VEQAGIRQGMNTWLSRRGDETFFFKLVVMKRGGEKYVANQCLGHEMIELSLVAV
jgi:hypothetical protein